MGEECRREGLTPLDDGTLLIDCEQHGAVATIAAGTREYERAEERFAIHRAALGVQEGDGNG